MKICMIGTGYVGLVSGACFSELGNNVICTDIDRKKINRLNNGLIPIYEPGLEELIKRNFKQGRLNFSFDVVSSIRKSDIIFICVGTPTNKISNMANLKYVFNVANTIKNNLNKYKVIVTKSTVPVTTGDKIEKIITDFKLNKCHDELLILTRNGTTKVLTNEMIKSSHNTYFNIDVLIKHKGDVNVQMDLKLNNLLDLLKQKLCLTNNLELPVSLKLI